MVREPSAEHRKLLLVGGGMGTNVGSSLLRAARRLGLDAQLLDIANAFAGPKLLRSLSWRVFGHRPLRLQSFSRTVLAKCSANARDWLLATGLAPITAKDLKEIGSRDIQRIVYLTDDPWNPVHRSNWFFESLPQYDRVFTPRLANLEQLAAIGCPSVSYLPFAYDEELAYPPTEEDKRQLSFPAEVLFVGGADSERVPMIEKLITAGVSVRIFGAEWPRTQAFAGCVGGYADPAKLRAATGAAKVNLCLVRRANRDGHVMRSFEAAAIGGCMLVEHTPEHEAIFGPDGECVVYFRDIDEMVMRCRELLGDANARSRLASAVRRRIIAAGNTYGDRLKQMLAAS